MAWSISNIIISVAQRYKYLISRWYLENYYIRIESRSKIVLFISLCERKNDEFKLTAEKNVFK